MKNYVLDITIEYSRFSNSAIDLSYLRPINLVIPVDPAGGCCY